MVARGAGPFGGNPFSIFILLILVYAFLTGRIAAPLRNAADDPAAFVGFLAAILLGITVHEFMHAYVAHRLGDDTGRLLGRMRLDPLAHLDLWGSLLIVLIGFGYGKPVPVNEARLRGGRRGMSVVAVAGPLTNLALAAVCAIPLRFGAADQVFEPYAQVLFYIVLYNCLLAVFNLIPVPPLDGSKVVYGFLSPRQAYSWHSYEQYGPFIILAAIFLLPILGINILGPLVITPAQALARLLLGPGF